MKLKMTRGDTAVFDLVVTDDNGAVNLTGGLMLFTVKSAYADADNAAVVQKKSSTGGIVFTDAAAGKARVTLQPSDTTGLTNTWKVLYWDAQLVLSGNVYTVASGTLEVRPDVTVSTS